MSTRKTYTGPVTGRVYNLAEGERIDPAAEGIGASRDKSSPDPVVSGRRLYNRIFIRLRTPAETLTCRPIADGKDFAQRTAIIEGWFDSVVRKGNYVLTFEVLPITDDEADSLEREGGKI